ncbi:hypothetical protein ACFX2G_030607 [Malus domestica]
MAPSDQGQVGSFDVPSQLCTGDPHRPGFSAKAVTGKIEKDLDISPVRRFADTLRSCRFGRFRPDIELEKWFGPSQSVRRWVKWLTIEGISLDKLL